MNRQKNGFRKNFFLTIIRVLI